MSIFLTCRQCNKLSDKYIQTHYGPFCSQAHFDKYRFFKLKTLSKKHKISIDILKDIEEVILTQIIVHMKDNYEDSM
jgi:hypothetical protein